VEDKFKIVMKNNIRTAVILCGGKGTRLGLIGKVMPKTLVRINGYPILWFIIKTLIGNSFNHFILPVGYKGHLIKKYIKNNKEFKNFKIDIINTGVNTSIAERIHIVKKKIISKDFLLLNGDAIFKFNLNKIFLNHQKKKLDLSFIGCENQLPYGTIGILNNKIVNFQRDIIFNSVKIRNKPEFTAYVYSGMSILNKKLLKINFKTYKKFEQELYPNLIKKYNCSFQEFKGFWHSIDNMKEIEETKKNIKYNKFLKIKKIIKNLNAS